MNENSNELIEIIEDENKKNEYSIYEYLKNTPSVFIAVVSTIVAIVTFFAKYITLISARKELEYWGIEPTYASFGDESLVFPVVISIVYSFLTMLVTLLFTATYEAYLFDKKKYLLVKYYKRSQRKIAREMKKKCRNTNEDSEEKQYCEKYNLISSIIKKLEKQSRKDLFINSIPIVILLLMNSFLFVQSNTLNSKGEIWQNILGAFIIQIITLWILSLFSNRKVLNKKRLKEECTDATIVMERIAKSECKEYPMLSFFTQGIKSFLNNTNISLVVIILLMNCFSVCITTYLRPIESENSIPITYVDDIQYAIVYQKGNQYFLEEAESEWQKDKSKLEYVLKIYTNMQRIVTTDDLLINVFEYDDVEITRKKNAE